METPSACLNLAKTGWVFSVNCKVCNSSLSFKLEVINAVRMLLCNFPCGINRKMVSFEKCDIILDLSSKKCDLY